MVGARPKLPINIGVGTMIISIIPKDKVDTGRPVSLPNKDTLDATRTGSMVEKL